MHQLSKDFLATNAFHHEDFSPIPQMKKHVIEVFEQLLSCSVFYFETTLPCRSGKFVVNRTYFLPNSLFYVSIYEKCDYFSDCYVVDGLKFEPTFIAKQSNLPFDKILEYKFGKLRQILIEYKKLYDSKK